MIPIVQSVDTLLLLLLLLSIGGGKALLVMHTAFLHIRSQDVTLVSHAMWLFLDVETTFVRM